MIEELKAYKKMSIDMGCDKYMARPIPVGGQVFNASKDNLTLYKQAYDLGLSLGMTVGKLPTARGVQAVTSETLQALILAMSKQIAKGLVKKGYYYMSIAKATTEAELEAIVWEDVRKK